MILNYDVPRSLEEEASEIREGKLIYIVDENNVATFIRLYQPNEVLKDNEKWLHFRHRKRRLRLGANSFFFQEGKASTFNGAKYGELRVDTNGHSVLVGLSDKNLVSLGFTSGLQ